MKARIEAFDNEDHRYLVHEFLHDDWEPLYITDALDSFAEAKLTYVGSATIGENRLILCVPKDLIEMVQSVPDLALRELPDFSSYLGAGFDPRMIRLLLQRARISRLRRERRCSVSHHER